MAFPWSRGLLTVSPRRLISSPVAHSSAQCLVHRQTHLRLASITILFEEANAYISPLSLPLWEICHIFFLYFLVVVVVVFFFLLIFEQHLFFACCIILYFCCLFIDVAGSLFYPLFQLPSPALPFNFSTYQARNLSCLFRLALESPTAQHF